METNMNTNINTNLETTHTLDFSDRLYKVAIAFIVVFGVAAGGWVLSQFAALPENAPHEVAVSGEGKAFAKPDIALISLGVTSEAAKSQDAVNQNNAKMDEIIKALKNVGVEDKDIQTTLYNLNPVYGYGAEQPIPLGAPASGAVSVYPRPSNRIVGYSLDQQVEVKIRNFDNINSILDAATSKGANMVGSLQFTIDDMEKFRAEAREKAIAQAKEKATLLFQQAGLSIDKLVDVSEGFGSGPMPLSQRFAAATEKSVAPNIQAGQLEIDSTITLTYRVK